MSDFVAGQLVAGAMFALIGVAAIFVWRDRP